MLVRLWDGKVKCTDFVHKETVRSLLEDFLSFNVMVNMHVCTYWCFFYKTVVATLVL